MTEISNKPQTDAALEFIWNQYRTFAQTSSEQKKLITKWRMLVLVFTITGALLGVLSQNLTILHMGMMDMMARILGALSGLSLSLAAYAGSQILTDEKEKLWIRARSAGEAFKSETYLYLLKAKPYDVANAKNQLFKRAEELIKATSDVQTTPLDITLPGSQPPSDLTIDKYMEDRVKAQIYKYYLPTARKYDRITKRSKNISFILGFISIILGTAGGLGFTEYSSVWIPFLGALTGSVAAYISSNRYQYLVVSYQATAKRLMMLIAQWSQLDRNNLEEQGAFVSDCEKVFSMESGAWMAEMSDTSGTKIPDKKTEEVAGVN
jgi:hypothetical protein